MNPEKTYLQSLYKCTHPIFYGTRFATEERGSRLRHAHSTRRDCEWRRRESSLSVLLHSSEAGHTAPATRRLFPLGAMVVVSTQPRRNFFFYLDCFFFFKYMYLQCG